MEATGDSTHCVSSLAGYQCREVNWWVLSSLPPAPLSYPFNSHSHQLHFTVKSDDFPPPFPPSFIHSLVRDSQVEIGCRGEPSLCADHKVQATAAWVMLGHGGNSIRIKHLRQRSLRLIQWAVGTTEVFASGSGCVETSLRKILLSPCRWDSRGGGAGEGGDSLRVSSNSPEEGTTA